MKLEMQPAINSVLKIAKATQGLQELPKTKLHCFQHQEIQKYHLQTRWRCALPYQPYCWNYVNMDLALAPWGITLVTGLQLHSAPLTTNLSAKLSIHLNHFSRSFFIHLSTKDAMAESIKALLTSQDHCCPLICQAGIWSQKTLSLVRQFPLFKSTWITSNNVLAFCIFENSFQDFPKSPSWGSGYSWLQFPGSSLLIT